MKKLTDEELQKLLEGCSKEALPDVVSVEEDAKVYELLFQELKKEPSFILPGNFAERVSEKIWTEKKPYAVFNIQTLVWTSIGAALLLSILAIFYLNATFIIQSVSMLLNFKWIIVFAIGIILLIELVDKYFVRRKIGLR